MKCFFILLFSVSVILTQAQTGTIDKTYGVDKSGTTTTTNQIFIQSSAVQSDNKILLGGYGPKTGQYLNYVITRHNTNGTLDTSFGNKGQTIITLEDLVKNIYSSNGWTSIAVLADGRIVTAGSVTWNNPDYPDNFKIDDDIVVTCFLPNGKPDESFGSHGRIVTNFGFRETATSVSVQKDGKIVIAGYQNTDINGNNSYILLARYNEDGSLDNSFGEGGYVKYTKTISHANSVLIQNDGKIVAGGSANAYAYFFLVRYGADGTIDKTFGNNGEVKTSIRALTGGTQINSLALDEEGRIAAAGVAGSEEEAVVVRYLPSGVLDNSFNKDGILELNLNGAPYAYANTVLSQPDNKLIVSSTFVNDGDTLWRLALTGLNEDGSLDPSFGTGKGQTITNIGFTDDVSVNAVMQLDNKIIVSGNSTDFYTNINANTYLLSRFNGYPVHVSLAVRIKRFVHNHSITWNGLPADEKIAYYSVEQSSSNRTGFLPIAKVGGRSNLHDYSFTNSSFLQGTNYYRIKAISTDGTIRYSEVVSADNIANSASVYPNPARSSITVQGLPNNETANISIKDGSGTVLSKGVSNGGTQYRSSLANLQPGTYYVNITTAGKTETLKFVKE